MTYNDIWQRLAPLYGTGEAKALARMLLEEMFNMSYADIICGSVDTLDASATARLDSALGRMEQSEPIQYVLGYTDFCGNRFNVAPGVLIPRPETEWIVERAVTLSAVKNHSNGSQKPLATRILDIGTGSGCIAISLKKALPNAYVEAWDISPDALSIAKDNAMRLSAEVEFKQCDALHAEKYGGNWDVIVSNPPYICEKERSEMAANVLNHEPPGALFVPDADPLLFYRAITHYAMRTLNDGGNLLFECNTSYADDTAAMMNGYGLADAAVANDCFGKPRFAEGTFKRNNTH